MRITHIRLANWRNFRSVNVDLQQRVFLVGPNAAGKSNFLDSVRFLRDVAVTVGGGFQEAVRRRGGVSSIRSLSARRYPDVQLEIAVGDDDAPNAWEYELTFSQDNNRRPLVKTETVKRAGVVLLERPTEDDTRDPERLTQTFLEQVNVNQPFRDLGEFLADVRYLHLVPQLVREPDRSVGRKNDPFGGDFLEQVATTQDRTRESRLRRIRDALAIAVPQLTELELSRDERGTPHLRGRYEHWRPQGAWQNEVQFSDGTLRLLALLWAVLDGSGPLLLEEPELSLHSEVVRYLPQLFLRVQRRAGRQILLSSHSPSLLQDRGIGLDEALLLIPDREGTRVIQAGSMKEITTLLDEGLSLADAIIPMTKPGSVNQLALFGEES